MDIFLCSPHLKKQNKFKYLKKCHGNGDSIRIGQEIQCLLYAEFLFRFFIYEYDTDLQTKIIINIFFPSPIETYAIFGAVEVLSEEITCLWRLLVSTDNAFHLILGFNSSTQTTVLTLNQDSRKGNLYRQWFSP